MKDEDLTLKQKYYQLYTTKPLIHHHKIFGFIKGFGDSSKLRETYKENIK